VGQSLLGIGGATVKVVVHYCLVDSQRQDPAVDLYLYVKSVLNRSQCNPIDSTIDAQSCYALLQQPSQSLCLNQ